jgi:predicted RNA-binding Zn-ribbon protein involved in translation (DUF1610 family)
MSRYDRECPACGRMISPRQVPLWQPRGFPCPGCSQLLLTNNSSLKWAWALALFLIIDIDFLFGVRSSVAIVTLLLGSVPLSFVIGALVGLVSPSPLELVPPKRRLESKSRLQLHLARFDKRCPACGEMISPKQIPTWQSVGFPCPACSAILKSSILPAKFILPLSFAASLLLCISFFGLRSLTVILASLGATAPMYFVVYAIVGLVVPPGLELVPKSDFRLDK